MIVFRCRSDVFVINFNLVFSFKTSIIYLQTYRYHLQRYIQVSCKHLRWRALQQLLKAFSFPLTIIARLSFLDVSRGPGCISDFDQG